MTMLWWDPANEAVSLRQAMDRLLEDAMIRPGRLYGGPETLGVPLDVLEHNDQFLVKASLPGLPPEDVHITVEDNVLTIEGELREEQGQPPQQTATGQPPTTTPANGKQAQQPGGAAAMSPRVHHRERRSGRFFRQVLLPASIDAGQAQATFEHGVLTLILPKAEQARRHQIAITRTGQAQPLPQGQAVAATH